MIGLQKKHLFLWLTRRIRRNTNLLRRILGNCNYILHLIVTRIHFKLPSILSMKWIDWYWRIPFFTWIEVLSQYQPLLLVLVLASYSSCHACIGVLDRLEESPCCLLGAWGWLGGGCFFFSLNWTSAAHYKILRTPAVSDLNFQFFLTFRPFLLYPLNKCLLAASCCTSFLGRAIRPICRLAPLLLELIIDGVFPSNDDYRKLLLKWT